MAKILEWEYTQPSYLKRVEKLDIKEEEEKLNIIAERLKMALEQHPELPYVTANQVGYQYAVFAVRVGEDILTFANPIMSVSGETFLARESEFGLDNTYLFPRKTEVHMIAYSYDKKLVVGRDFTEKVDAAIMQHIQNNLDGISIQDVGLEVTPEFEQATKEEQGEVLEYYLKELDTLLLKLELDIKADSEVSQKYDALKFLKAKADGNIEAHREVKKNRATRRFLDKIAKKFKKKKK